MILEDAIILWADELGFNAGRMLNYAERDDLGGEDTAEWPAGSIWSCDGQMLYALIRTAGIVDVLEFGTGHGCSTSHIAKALHDNGRGTVVTLDRPGSIDKASYRVPKPYDVRVERILEGGLSWIKRSAGKFELIFEDGPHTTEFTKEAVKLSLPRLRPGGFVVVHDVYGPHGRQVWPGLRTVVPDAKRIAIGPGRFPIVRRAGCDWALTKALGWQPCRGLGYWRKPV